MPLPKYKDTYYSKSSELADAIESDDELRAKRIYLECELVFQQHVQGTHWAKPIEQVKRELKETITKIEKIRLDAENKAKK